MTDLPVSAPIPPSPFLPPPPLDESSEIEARFPRPVLAAATLWALATLVSRGIGLTRPRTLVFDEAFYVSDAVDLIRHGVEGGSAVHPPVGKWMLAAGIELFGLTPLGWRAVPLLAGVAVVGLTHLAGWRATGSRLGASVAAAAVFLDGVSITTGRTALLDGLVALWSTAALLVLVDLVRRPLDGRARQRRRWMLGLLLGLGVATKWSVALLVPVALFVLLALDHRYGPPSRSWTRPAKSVVAVVVVPLVVYVATYAAWFWNYDDSRTADCGPDVVSCDDSLIDRAEGFVRYQLDIADYHRTLEPTHPDVAPGWTWVIQRNPVDLFQKVCRPSFVEHAGESDGICTEADRAARIVSLGNPVVWLTGFMALCGLVAVAVQRRSMMAGAVAAFGWAMWVPWLLGGRPAYSFYGAPLVPVLGVAAAMMLGRLPGSRRGWAGALVGLQLLVAAWLWPVWTGIPIDPDWVNRFLVFDSWQQ